MKTKNIKLSKEEKEIIRKTAIKLIVEGLHTKREVAKILDVNYDSVCAWYKKFKK